MPEFVVVLVQPIYAGNIGSVARSMANFGMSELVLVNPCDLGDDAYRFAKHARPIVENARIVMSFEEALADLDLVVGTSGVLTENERKFNRHPMTPKEFVEFARKKDGRLGLVFGREDQGLFNDEIARCDVLVNIPTSPDYPIMNISQAATVIFYELGTEGTCSKVMKAAGKIEKETLNDLFAELLDAINYPEHKKPKTKVMIRRILARADLSKWEFHTFAGVISRASKRIGRFNTDTGKKTANKEK